jgi:hypothetical protein
MWARAVTARERRRVRRAPACTLDLRSRSPSRSRGTALSTPASPRPATGRVPRRTPPTGRSPVWARAVTARVWLRPPPTPQNTHDLRPPISEPCPSRMRDRLCDSGLTAAGYKAGIRPRRSASGAGQRPAPRVGAGADRARTASHALGPAGTPPAPIARTSPSLPNPASPRPATGRAAPARVS